MSVELVVATFEGDENKAEEVLNYLNKLEAEGTLQLEHVAVVAKTDKGEVEVKDVGDVDAKRRSVRGEGSVCQHDAEDQQDSPKQ